MEKAGFKNLHIEDASKDFFDALRGYLSEKKRSSLEIPFGNPETCSQEMKLNSKD
jgi:hypothetical protein